MAGSASDTADSVHRARTNSLVSRAGRGSTLARNQIRRGKELNISVFQRGCRCIGFLRLCTFWLWVGVGWWWRFSVDSGK